MIKSLEKKSLDKHTKNNSSRFSLLLFTSCVLLLASNLSAQVIIKERVEINPEASTQLYYPAATFEPCGLYPVVSNQQYVYSCSAFPVEPYQQLFPYQSSSGLQFSAGSIYEIEITEGIDYAYMERIAYTDSLGNFYEAEYLGSLITGLPGYLLSGTGKYQGWQPTGTFLRENSTNYYIHFDNYSLQQTSVTVRITNLNTQETTYWKTVIVNPQLQIVNQQYENDTLLHYYSKDVSLQLYNINSAGCQHPGYGGCPPDNVRFNIEIIEGQQYGNIKNGLTGDFSTSFTGIPYNELYTFTYYANGLQPEDSAVVRIRHSSNDADITPIEFSFVVKRNTIPPPSEGGSIYVKMDKNVVIPGDTVNVQLRLIDETGDTVDFLAMQSFSVDLAEGAEYGTILDIITEDTSDSFADIGNMFKIIIEDQITPQQAKIIVVAQTDLMIWSRPVSINNKTKEKEHTADIVHNGGGTTPDIIIIGDHLVGVGEITITKSPIIVEILPAVINAGDTAQIIPKKLNSDGTTTAFDSLQSFEIGMLEGCEAGQILFGDELAPYFNNITQPIYFVADSNLTETDTVKIRVGLIEGSASRPVKTNGMDEETLVLNKNKSTQQKPLEENTAAYCFIGEIDLPITADGILVVGDECDFDNCGDSYDDIQIELLTQPNGFQHAIYQLILENGSVTGAVVDVDTTTVCDLDSSNIKNGVVGQSTPVPYSRLRKNTSSNWEKSWILSPCKNDTGAIEYRTITKDSVRTPIYLDFVADVCYDLIAADTSNLTLVNDTTALKDTIIIKDATIAFHDICGHRCYPQIVSKDGYIFKEIVYLHELQHRNHYKDIVDSLKQTYLINKFKLDFTNDCTTFSQTIKNAESDSSSFESKIKQYVQEATIEYHLQSGLEYKINGSVVVPENLSKEESNEKKRHSAQLIKDLVNTYLFALHNSRGTPWPVTTCMTCP